MFLTSSRIRSISKLSSSWRSSQPWSEEGEIEEETPWGKQEGPTLTEGQRHREGSGLKEKKGSVQAVLRQQTQCGGLDLYPRDWGHISMIMPCLGLYADEEQGANCTPHPHPPTPQPGILGSGDSPAAAAHTKFH